MRDDFRHFRIRFAPLGGGTLEFTRRVALTNELIEDIGLEFPLYKERLDAEREALELDGIRIRPIRLYELVQVFMPGEADPRIEERDFKLLVPADRFPSVFKNAAYVSPLSPEVWP